MTLESEIQKRFKAKAQVPIYLKLESQHPTGSFKVRPAFFGILSHLEAAKKKGVLTSSSGNFAQAVAYAARALHLRAQIVMTSNTAPYKIERTKAQGAEVILCGPSFQERWDTTHRLRQETGRVFLHPYDSEETIEGNSTVGQELLAQMKVFHSPAFRTLVPVSGGGLVAGISKILSPTGNQVYGIQPELNASLKKSLEAGKRVEVPAFHSCADALVALTPGEKTFEICRKNVRDVLLVSENAIISSVKWLFEEQKLVVEPGAAVGVAALLEGLVDVVSEVTPVVCVISGGNVSLDRLKSL